MGKGKGLWLCTIATLMLTTVAIAQDEDRNPDEKELDRDPIPRVFQDRMEMFVRRITDPLVQRVSKSVVQRYNLDQTAVSEFRQSIQESAEALLKQPGSMLALTAAARKGNYTKMLETLLSHPNCKTVFAKYLNKEQLRDYLDFTLARGQRNRGAVARHLTAWLDQQLSLTVDQREKIEQRLTVNADKGSLVDAGDILWNRLHPETVIRRRFKHPPDDVLSQTQLVIWKQLTKFDKRSRIPEHARKEIVAGIIEDLKADKIAHGGGEVVIIFQAEDKDEVVIKLRDEDKVAALIAWSEDEDAASESQEEMRRIAAAKLAAHTQPLGPLDETASQRLVLVAKGVVEEYLDAQGRDSEPRHEKAEKEIHEAVAVGKMTNQEAAQKLEGLKKRLHVEERATNSDTDITHHPLYQQTIKDVLSEEGFAQYKARQAERQDFRLQALRDVLVASMDTELFLSNEQRKHFERAAEELLDLSTPDEVPAPVYIAYQLCQRTDHELLSPWQQEEFERIHRELETRVKFIEAR